MKAPEEIHCRSWFLVGCLALQESEALIPPSDRMGELTAQIQPIVAEMIGLKVQSRILGELRDALLPKLMSGEIDVSQVAFYAGRATPSL
jgi:hypothetical protein